MRNSDKTIVNCSLHPWQAASECTRGIGKNTSVLLGRTTLLACMLVTLPLAPTAWAAGADNLLVGAGGAGGVADTCGCGGGGDGGIGGGGGGGGGFTFLGGGGGGGIGGGGGGGESTLGGAGGGGGIGGGSGGAAGSGSGGSGGIGGGGGGSSIIGGGGGGGIGGNGGTGSYGGGNGGDGDGVVSGVDPNFILPGNRTYSFVGVGGGGGGEGQLHGDNGGDGNLTVNSNRQLTIEHSLLIGGSGGGGGGGGGSGGGGGGNGGNGSMTLDNASMSVGETLLVGGSGGGGSFHNGGYGGDGGLSILHNASVTVGGALILGGEDGASANGIDGLNGLGGSGGAGTLNLGAGSIDFGGTATFTIRTGSTFNIGNASANGTDAGAITGLAALTNDGAINFNQRDASYTFGTAIVGSGSVTHNSAGTTILTGPNMYTGGTTIMAGTLQIGNGGTAGAIVGDIDIGSNATLAFDHSDPVWYSGTLTGGGNLVKHGANMLAFGGSNGYTGDTTIDGGTLQFGSYSQNAGQLLRIGVASNADYGKLAVVNTASFAPDAKLDVNVAGVNTLASGQTLSNVISAGTLDASTFDVTDNSALFNFEAVLDGNHVDLNISQASVTHSGVLDAVLADGASSAAGAARVLDNLINAAPSGDMGTVIAALGQLGTQREVGRAAAQTLPLLSGGVTQSTLGMLSSFNRVVGNRLNGIGAGSANAPSGVSSGEAFADRQVWAKAFGSRADQDDHDGAAGFSADSWGMALGVDGELDRDTRIGLAYAYANSRVNGNTDLSGTQQRADIDSHVLAIYGSKGLANDVLVDFQADVGRNSTDGTRPIDFGGLTRTATSDYASYSAHVGTGVSKAIALNRRTTFAPGLRVDYTRLRDRGYDESGADALNLHVDGNTTEALVLTAEGRLRYAVTERSWLSANLGIGYDTINDRSNIVSAYAGAPGQAFTTTGIDHSPWLFSGGFGYTMQAGAGTQVMLRYDAEGRSGYVNQTASVKASWMF